MRLCFISDPNSVHTRRWVGWFAQHGHEVCLVADIPVQQPWPEVQVIDLSKRFYAPVVRFPVWATMLKQILRQWAPDILHAHRVNSAGWVGAMTGFHPFVVTSWGSDLNTLDRQSRLTRWLAAYVVRRADLITANADNLLRKAQALGAQIGACHRIQWGVDIRYFHPGSAPELRDQLGITGSPVILSPRAIAPIYNIHIILAAMPEVLAHYPQATLVLRDFNSDPGYKAQLLTQIDSLGIEASVRWLGRITPWEANAAAYRLADLVISVPTTDGMAPAIWESMASGLPVITSDIPVMREWIKPGENGLLVPVGDAAALALAVLRLLGDQDLQARFSQNGIDLARDNADHEAEMAKMENLYRSLLPAKP